jgi:hypothetical protein
MAELEKRFTAAADALVADNMDLFRSLINDELLSYVGSDGLPLIGIAIEMEKPAAIKIMLEKGYKKNWALSFYDQDPTTAYEHALENARAFAQEKYVLLRPYELSYPKGDGPKLIGLEGGSRRKIKKSRKQKKAKRTTRRH